MIEVFKTNVNCPIIAASLTELLKVHCLHCDISFDLEDCDRVLRIAGARVEAITVIMLIRQQGFYCEVLD